MKPGLVLQTCQARNLVIREALWPVAIGLKKALALAEILCIPVVGAEPGLGRAPGKGRGDAECCCAMKTILGSGYGELWKIL